MHMESIPVPFDKVIASPADSPEREIVANTITALWEFVYSLSDAEEIMNLDFRPR